MTEIERWHQKMYGYFRMALTTGLVDLQSVIAWADNELMKITHPPEEIMELSLSSRLSYSQMIRLLSSYQGPADYDLPLKMLFARALALYHEDPHRAGDIILGLRLLVAEEYLPAETRHSLIDLDCRLDAFHQGLITYGETARHLSAFLTPYNEYSRYVYPAIHHGLP
jgi:hypothetical protein